MSVNEFIHSRVKYTGTPIHRITHMHTSTQTHRLTSIHTHNAKKDTRPLKKRLYWFEKDEF